MAWITATHSPGFAEDLAHWRLRVSTAYKAEVFENGDRVVRRRLTDDQVRRIEDTLSREDFGLLEIHHDEVVDDAPSSTISVTCDGTAHRVEWNGCSARESPEVARFKRVWGVLAEIAAPHLRTRNGLRL